MPWKEADLTMEGGILFSMPGEKVFSTPGGNFLAIYNWVKK